METKHLPLSNAQIKMSSDSAFSGYASVFNGIDAVNDTILPGAFKSVIDSGKSPKMFFNHASYEVPVGVWEKLKEDETGLHVTGKFVDGYEKANAVKSALKAGALDGLSIGFMMGKDDFEETEKGRVIKNISDLVEISIVTFPADNSARVDLASVKSNLDQIDTLKEFERFLRESGNYSKSLTTALVSKFKALVLSESRQEQSVKDAINNLLNNFR